MDVEEDTKGPDIRLGEGLSLLQDFGGSIVKVVSALDLGTVGGDGLGGLKVGQLDLDGPTEGTTRADKDVGRPLGNVSQDVSGWERSKLKKSILVRLVGVHQADHLLVAESLQVLELPHGSLIALRGIFVEGLDRVDLAVLVDIGSDGKAALGNLRHEVEASKTLGLDLQWLLLTLV